MYNAPLFFLAQNNFKNLGIYAHVATQRYAQQMGNGRRTPRAVELLRSLQDLLACDGCGTAFVASNDEEEEDAARRKPITLDCGHHICRSCGNRATAARKGFYEATCPATKDGRCVQRVTAKDFAEEEEEHNVNIKLVEIAHRAKELETKLKERETAAESARRAKELTKDREGRNDDAEEKETAEEEEKNCGPLGDAVSMWTLTAAFESELLRTACESAMEIMGDPDTPPSSAGRERGDEEAMFAKLEERRKANMTCASERERLEAIEECERTIAALKEKKAKIRRAREIMENAQREEEKENETSLKDLSVLREKVTEEIDAMTTNQLRARYVHMHGEAPAKGMTKSEYRKIFANVDPNVWLETTKYMEGQRKTASRNRTSLQSWNHQPQEEGVLVVRDSLGCDEDDAMMAGEVVTGRKATTTGLFQNPFPRLRSSNRISNKRRASTSFDFPEVFALTNASNETQKSMKDAAYDEILNQMMQCGRHAVVIKDDNEPLDDDVTHCVVTTGATIANDVKAQNGAKKKYIIKKRSLRYLESLARGIWIVSSEWLDSRKGTKKYANEEDFEIHDAAGTWNMGTDGLDGRIFNSTSVHRKNKENYLRICGGDENKNERGVFGSSESDSLMLTRTARSAKHIEAAKSSGIFNGLKIVVDVPDFFFSLNSSDGKNNKKSSTTITTSRTEWTIRKSDCERILESAGAEVIRERDYVVLDSYFGENETYSPVPDSEEDEEDEEDERNLKQQHHEKQQQQQQQMSKNDVKFQEKTCASIDYVFLDGTYAQTHGLQIIEKTRQTFPNAKVVDWHWFVHSLVKGYTLETEDTYEMPLCARYPRENYRL